MVVEFKLKTAASVVAIATATAKLYARKDSSEEDTLFANSVTAATQWVEDYTGRGLMTQTWQLELSQFARRIWLPRAAPLASVTSVKYYDTAGTLQTVSSAVYNISTISEPAYIELAAGQSWPTPDSRSNAVLIEYVVGVSDAANVPQKLLQAIEVIVTAWADDRTAEIPQAAIALCAPSRVFWREPEAA